jgi:hypothetical protein
MSWLLNKAEDFLNKVDQSAADALNDDQHAKQSKLSYNPPGRNTEPTFETNVTSKPPVSYSRSDSQNSLPYSVSVPANLSKLNTSSGNGASTAGTRPRPLSSNGSASRKKDKDDVLFEFLNSEEPVDNNARKMERVKPVFTHSRQSSTSSTVSNKSGKPAEAARETTPVMSSTENGKSISSKSEVFKGYRYFLQFSSVQIHFTALC